MMRNEKQPKLIRTIFGCGDLTYAERYENNDYDLIVACCKKKHVFNLADVIRFEASSNYTLIHSINQRPLVVAKVLADYECMLKEMGFVRVHRSHLLNRRYVHSVDSCGSIIMYEGFKVEVPRRKKKEIIRRLLANENRAQRGENN
jgi:two-component system LytT family response regulator